MPNAGMLECWNKESVDTRENAEFFPRIELQRIVLLHKLTLNDTKSVGIYQPRAIPAFQHSNIMPNAGMLECWNKESVDTRENATFSPRIELQRIVLLHKLTLNDTKSVGIYQPRAIPAFQHSSIRHSDAAGGIP
jgi:hypothetical protein